jgi:acyl-CoA synthetase (AMP-forming)/AMP-acid ligase II
MHYLGVMPAILLSASESARDDMSSQVKFGFGAGCDPRHQAGFEARFGVPLIEAWAMTETGAGAWITAQHEPRHVGRRCFGRAPAELEWRLVDEAGADSPRGEAGELLVRRAGDTPRRYFFSGYLKDAPATEEAWAGGWFHTGDVVQVDEEGNFYFVDRRKNVIRRSGENIAAIEVESVLMRHEGVGACAVAPVEDEVRGEEVAALIVAKSDANEALAISVVEHALAQLAYYKAPGYVFFAEALPMTASEKVKRGDVKARLREAVARGACFDLRVLKKRPSAA